MSDSVGKNNDPVVLTETLWQIYTFLKKNGGTCTIAEAVPHLGRNWGAAGSALRELQYKGLVTSTRRHTKAGIPATFTLVPGKSAVYFPK